MKEIYSREDYSEQLFIGRLGFEYVRTEQILEQIVREHHAMIKRIAASYESQQDLMDELVQEIYLAIWGAVPSFRGDSSLRTFVARIATNRAVTHVARSLRLPPSCELNDHLPGPGESPEKQAIVLDQQARLIAAVRHLPLPYRQTAMLTLEGFTPGEIGEVLGISANAVAIRLCRAKELLRRLIGGKP